MGYLRLIFSGGTCGTPVSRGCDPLVAI